MELRLLALLCLVGAAFAGPFQRETGSRCSTHCPKKAHYKFNYDVGKKYVYEHRGENYITIAGNRKQKATIEGLAEFHFTSKCAGVIKLKNVRLHQKLSESETSELIKKFEIPMRFSYEDGKLEKVCPSPLDTKQSINIKKGVLSTIVNTQEKLDVPEEVKEYDSLGKCLTKYTVKHVSGLVVRKVKDLKSCTNRHASVTSLITNPYDSPNSKINTLPVFPEESLVCDQTIGKDIIKDVKCKEHAKIKPLKHRDSIIQFDGAIELKFLRKESSDLGVLDESNGPESIMYNLEEQKDAQTLESETEDILRDMCSKNNGVLDPSASKDFIKLITLVKTLEYSTLKKTHESLKNGRLCSSKKVLDMFLDTLPMANSDASIKLMVLLLEKKEITGLKAKLWPASLALIPKPSRKTIESIMPLLNMVDSGPVLLGVSAIVHQYCRIEDCKSDSGVAKIIEELKPRLSSKDEEKVFTTMKGFSNMGYLGEAEAPIVAYAQDRSKPLKLRLAAVDAFRRTNKKRPEGLLRIILDTTENYELRIACLASVMKHADAKQLERILLAMEHERNDEVLAYAISHIKNLNTTSSPLKKHVKSLLKDIEFNPRKVGHWNRSINMELSVHSEALNAGVAVEGDVIHSPDSSIPRSAYSRFDVDVLGKSLNIFQFGVRAEGLQTLVEKLIGLKEKTPRHSSWDPRSILREHGGDISVFFRTMDVEMFDFSLADITALHEIIQIAELARKLSHERKADFSHSFLFLNSQLVIPSVTGRSYTLSLTGSATVALTASTKINLLGFPRKAEARAHFQPSANVEISTTVGIQSNKNRPDIKLVSRVHLESNVDAKVHIKEGKEGHAAVASLTLPSENVILAKFSSDAFEIDSDHNEKRLFEEMQTKVDYCFDKLEKPLGLSVCGKWEVPKPFVIKSFPFIQGVGNVEFAVKKTDSSFNSYEASIEIPRSHSHHMRYIASLDTPGSQVKRRFAAELDIDHRSRGRSDLKLQLTSPFKSAGGSGSLTRRSDLVEGSIELHYGSSSVFTVNASSSILSSRSRSIYKPSLRVSFLRYDPLDLKGTVSITKGKKQQITIDLASNKPRSKPVAIKGTILKEGRLSISSRSEWKVSSDLSIRSPVVDGNIRNAVEKKSGPISKISTSLSSDYQIRQMQKHSIKLSGLAQSSSSKTIANARLEATQFPAANFEAQWNNQIDSSDSLINDVSIKYGRNPENTYITLTHKSHKTDDNTNTCEISVKAPQFDIDSDATLKSAIVGGDTPKILLDADIRYKADNHVKGLVQFDYLSQQPLKANTRIELEYPGRKLSYNDKVEEIDTNHIKGISRVEWGEEKYAELEYRYQRLDQPGYHYELEGSLRTPALPSPIKSKLAYNQNQKSVNLEGQLSLQRNQEYSMEAHLNKHGLSQVSIRAPRGVEGDLKIRNKVQQKSIQWEWKSNTPKRHIVGGALLNLESTKKQLKVELLTDADRHPDRKIAASTELSLTNENSVDRFAANLKLQVFDHLSLSLTESGDVSLLGKYESTLEASLKNHQPFKIEYEHNLSKRQGKSVITFSRNGVQKTQFEIEGSVNENGNEVQISGRTALKSLDNSFESKEVSMSHQLTKSGSSVQVKSHLKYMHSPSKIFEAEWDSGLQRNGVEVRAQVHTPHQNYRKQAVGLSVKRSDRGVLSSLKIELPNERVIAMASDIQAKHRGLVANWKAETPFEIVRNVKVHLSLVNERDSKKVLSSVDVNSARIADVEASMVTSSGLELKGQIKIAPVPNVSFQGLSFSVLSSKSLQSFSGKVDLANSKQISVSSEIKEEGESISAMASYSTPYSNMKDGKVLISVSNPSQSPSKNFLVYVDVNGERKGDIEVKVTASPESYEIQGRMKTSRTPEVSLNIKVETLGESLAVSGKILKGTSPLWSAVVSKQKQENGEKLIFKTESFEKTMLDLQISNEISDEHVQLKMKASGPFTPVSLVLSTSSSEKSSVRMEISACTVKSSSKCYTLKAYHKEMRNSEEYNKYNKLTFDLEKSNGDSNSEQIGSVHVLLSSTDHDYRSKVVLQYQEKNIGYDIRIHRRQRESDRCSMDVAVMMPDQTSRLRSSILHSTSNLLLEVEAIPNEAALDRKYSTEIKWDRNPSKNEVSGHIKMIAPEMSKPLLLKGKMERRGLIPVRGKVELHYSPSSWSKVWTLEVVPEIDSSGMKSSLYRLYRDDESVDFSMKLKRLNSRDEDKYGCDWSYKFSKVEKKGGMIVTLTKTSTGKPKSIAISYYAPNTDLKLEGASDWEANGPSQSVVRVLSKGQVIKEIRLLSKDSCLFFEVERSGPFFKSSACINKRDEQTKSLQLVSIDAVYRQRKCLDIRVGVDPSTPSFLDVVLEWKREDLLTALSELTGWKDILGGRTLKELERKVREKIHQIVREVLKPRWRKLEQTLKESKEQYLRKLREILKDHSRLLKQHMKAVESLKRSVVSHLKQLIPWETIEREVLGPLRRALTCLIEGYTHLIVNNIPEVARLVWETTKKQFELCLRTICSEGTFCHHLLVHYEQHGFSLVRNIVQRRIDEIKEKILTRWLPRFLSPWRLIRIGFKIAIKAVKLAIRQWLAPILTPWKLIRRVVRIVTATIEEVFGKFIGRIILRRISQLIEKLKDLARQRALALVDYVINRIKHWIIRAEEDEDFRTAMTLAKDAKRKVLETWERREQIVREAVEPIEESITENVKKIIDERFQWKQYDPSQGLVSFRIRNFLGKDQFELLINELRKLKQKVLK